MSVSSAVLVCFLSALPPAKARGKERRIKIRKRKQAFLIFL
ncbi:hypothetical protein TREAZ_2743 [Leadbettera azotonutricia ZAS-9]|uniref:Uncharacterized protein n=1 Tax=Leadbettera azotonutricia (strain ATCC BAA-888 / DSM 13862 / ZAS-9) TaxID=545695 RepID=F5YD70_LEAAZ|nr:hypothetical protein TREAZ_2743 [Leadbettera azotonutricia ZAS-9]